MDIACGELPICSPHASWRKVGLQGSAVKQTGDIVACGSVGWPAGPASGCHLHPPAGPLRLLCGVGVVHDCVDETGVLLPGQLVVSQLQASSNRKDAAEKGHKLVEYPDNLYLSDLLYFCWAPTLCYELNFPRNPRIRKVFLLRRILEAVFLLHVVLAIFQQWLMPTALNSLEPFRDMDYTRMLERLLLLALPNHVFWLLFFYFFFHSCMNLVGELLRFADREFYGDWWNSDSIQQFWKMWNIPVHRWAIRHIYHPLKLRGWHRGMATMMVFFLSAFFHEYLVSIPLLMLRPWAFTAMLFQVMYIVPVNHGVCVHKMALQSTLSPLSFHLPS
ncbi:Diacylglycerol O-acyltransferase 1, partial [Geodia barretti]